MKRKEVGEWALDDLLVEPFEYGAEALNYLNQYKGVGQYGAGGS